MAALTEQPPVAPSTFDQDIDSFLNLDQLTYTSAEPSRSKTTLTSQPAIQNPEFVANNQSPVIFQGPSHQYDEHKQQTGLPPGALAQAMTFNQMNGMGFGGASPGYPLNGDMMSNPPMKREDSLDFNSLPTRNPSDMDLESDSMSAVPGYYFSPNPNNKNQFVDPNALGGQEVIPMGPSTQVGRMYPGMHQQQAAMARAAQQQKHHEMIRQQQMQQQHQQQQQQRRMDEHMQQTAPSMDQTRAPNPVVDERISRLLQQMRQTSVTSPDETPSPSALPQMTKAKKDEQEMDEDERLLASEEGKKLSSKERRQLRNKVSARAFRSRRKEYIGQLESEVAAKTNEAHELRLQNRALFEENARLTDLARMLLSSPHFSQFLDEMNANGIPFNNPTQPAQPQAQPSQPQPQPQPQQHPVMSQPPMQSTIPKEATPAHPTQDFTTSQTPHVGMVMVPQQTMDVSAMNLNSGWNSGIDMNYANASVFAVLEVPEPPVIDTEYLSGKGSGLASYLPQPPSAKDEAPVLEPLPVAERSTGSDIGVEDPEYEIDESDPAFALFKDSAAAAPVDALFISSFDGLRSDKPAPVYELIVENESRAAGRQLAHFCHDMEAAFQRVSLVTSHLL